MVRFMPALFLVASFGIALAILGGAGAMADLGAGETHPLHDDVESEASEIEEIDFDPEDGGDSFLGSTVSTVRGVIGVMNLVLVFPTLMEWFGMPAYAAQPLGWGISILMGLGVYQIIRGDQIR